MCKTAEVAHPQVRDVASWAGNVMIAKTHPDFPSDICLLLSTLGAKLTLMNASKKTETLGTSWIWSWYVHVQP